MGIVTNRRRVMGGNPLPYDSVVEYLESTGTQWIDTLFVPQQDDVRFIIECAVNGRSDNIFVGMARYGSNDFAFNFYRLTSIYWWFGGRIGNFSASGLDHQRLEVGVEIIYNGNLVTTVSPTSSFVGNTSRLALFGQANRAIPTDALYKASGKIYSFSIYYGNQLQLDFIPVRVGQVGYMYDRVSGQLFGNAGTGAFVVGPDVNN